MHTYAGPKTATRLFLLTILTVLGGSLLGGGVLALLAQQYDIALFDTGVARLSVAQRQALRLGLLFNNGLQFAGAALLIVSGIGYYIQRIAQ